MSCIFSIPNCSTNARAVLWACALPTWAAGARWSITTTTLEGSCTCNTSRQTLAIKLLSNKQAISTFTVAKSPGLTVWPPPARLKIFSMMVIPITGLPSVEFLFCCLLIPVDRVFLFQFVEKFHIEHVVQLFKINT